MRKRRAAGRVRYSSRGHRRTDLAVVKSGAERRLRGFTRATVLAVALTGMLLLLVGGEEAEAQEAQGTQDTAAAVEQPPVSQPVDTATGSFSEPATRPDSLARAATEEARETFEGLWFGFVDLLPKLVVVLLVLLLAWGLVRLTRPLLKRLLGRWEKGTAAAALFGIAVWLLAVGTVVSVLAGDIRALLGSLGLVGLALSWALQTPIESFTGWLLNSFQGYYKVGDRIAVGDIFGDVVDIDFLTTTVWEIGGPDHPPPAIQAEQPTGRILTFPNSEVLTGSIINYTRDFNYVWDELSIGIASECDIRYAARVAEEVASELFGDYMREPVRLYRQILQRAGLNPAVSEVPELYFALTPSGVDITVRYLVGARERRKWKSELGARLVEAFGRSEHAEKIIPLYERRQVQLIGPDGVPRPWPLSGDT